MPPGTVLFTSRAPIGYVAIAGNEVSTNQGFKSVVPSAAVVPDYVAIFFQAFAPQIDAMAPGTTFREVSGKIVAALPFPLPPLAEQHRIVTKVDELMALSNQLEAAQREREARRDRVHSASLQRLTSSGADETTHAAGVRFFMRQSSRLITKPEHVGTIRQMILDLAVRGRLVPQDPGDEPARLLLRRLEADGSQQGTTARGVSALSAAEEPAAGVPFLLPDRWTWARFSDVARIQSHLVDPASFGDLPHIAPDNIESGSGRLLPFRTIRDSAVSSNKHLFEPGVILYSKIRPALAKAVLVDFGGLCSADMYPILSLIDRRYLHAYMLSQVFVEQSVKTDNRVAMPKINQGALSAISVPVPPLAEQQRIVAKVDQLTAVCDELQAGFASVRHRRARLLETLLRAALDFAVPNLLRAE
jgi:type I restriction enzyme S subunit